MSAESNVVSRAKELGRLWWLFDAPLFIDNALVGKAHDAAVLPRLENETISSEKFSKLGVAGGAEVNAEVGVKGALPFYVSYLLPKLEAEGKVGGSLSASSDYERGKRNGSTGTVVSNSERKLRELVLQYLEDFPERVIFVDTPGGTYSNFKGPIDTAELDRLLETPPRPLVFMNIMPKTPVLPMMVEMEAGGFRPVYEAVDARLLASVNPAPRYEEDPTRRAEYWKAIGEHFSSRACMEVLEVACDGGRIGWVDFRTLFKQGGETLHLHMVPAGAYHSGVFAYNFIHRGYKYGIRLVGSLRAGNSLNVLALYDR